MVSRLWGGQIAGPVFAVLGLILPMAAIWLHVNAAATIWLCAGPLMLAALLIWSAQYKVWESEYERSSSLSDELNASADMRGMILLTIGEMGQVVNFATKIRVRCDVSNHGRKPCEISKVRVVIKYQSGLPPVDQIHQLSPKEMKMLQPGECFPLDRWLDVPMAPLKELATAGIEIRLIDSLGVEYKATTTIVARFNSDVLPQRTQRDWTAED